MRTTHRRLHRASPGLLVLTFALASMALASMSRAGECRRPWVFFDLGDTVVDTSTHDFNPMFYLRAVSELNNGRLLWKDGAQYRSAKDYIDDLVLRRFRVGLLVDIPEEWGRSYPAEQPIEHLPTAKIVRTMDFLAGIHPEDGSSWRDETPEGRPLEMDWSPFGRMTGTGLRRVFVGRIFLPQLNSERKGNGSTVLFERAARAAAREGCPAVFQGEVDVEMELAERAGMKPFRVGLTDSVNFYLPIERIREYAENYRPGRWRRER